MQEGIVNIIIAGGSGFIGSSFSRHLVKYGHHVWILSRNPSQQQLPPGVTGVQWDGSSPDGWGQLVNEADVFINLTGENLAGGLWSAARKQRFLTSRVNPGRAIVKAIQEASHRPKVLMQSSAIGYYGDSADIEVDEDAPVGEDYMAQLCVQWENSTRPVEDLGVRRVIIRTSIVLSRESLILKLFLLPFRMFVGGKLGSGKQWVPWIHIDDQIGAMLHLINNESAGGVYNFAAPQVLRNEEFERTIGKVLRRPYWFPVPAFALRMVIGEMSTMVLEGQRASVKKLLDSGFEFRYPTLESALIEILKS
jgi:uncharacterized protein (TIGR01777 family)